MAVLIIAAHPDDETLGCGGTIAKCAEQNTDAHILILGEGIRSRGGTTQPEDDAAVRKLQEDAENAAKILGAASISFESFPDNRFDTVPLLDIVKTIESYVRSLQPRTVFTHHGGDLNIDHTITSRATLTAIRPMKDSPVHALVTYETPSATEWAFDRLSPPFTPSLFMNITTNIETKLKAMAAYQSEVRSSPHPRSPEALKALARMRGSSSGFEFAEAFSIVYALKK